MVTIELMNVILVYQDFISKEWTITGLSDMGFLVAAIEEEQEAGGHLFLTLLICRMSRQYK